LSRSISSERFFASAALAVAWSKRGGEQEGVVD
jgi:hypothetical protein